MNPSDEDPEVLWQLVLDELAAGRRAGLKCPFCKNGEIRIDESPMRTRLECAACKRFVEGKMS